MRKNWIRAGQNVGEAVITFEKAFALIKGKKIKKATLQASAMGVYAAYCNGERLGKGVLAPGWTSYRKRIFYQTYDITNLLQEKNLLQIGVGQGWAMLDKNLGRVYTDHVSLNAQVTIEYENGKKQTFYTDESWEVKTSEVLFANIYYGETVDKTAQIKSLGKAVKDESVKGKCVKQDGEWITEQDRLAPVEFIVTPKGEKVIDFGQNMTGYVEVKIQAPRGSKIDRKSVV